MFKSFVHVQPLKLRLLTAGDYVDVVAAAQAVIEDAQQAVAVRRIVHADGFAAARQGIVDKSSRLVAEADRGDFRQLDMTCQEHV